MHAHHGLTSSNCCHIQLRRCTNAPRTARTHRRPAHSGGDAEHGDEGRVEAAEAHRRLRPEEGGPQDRVCHGRWRVGFNRVIRREARVITWGEGRGWSPGSRLRDKAFHSHAEPVKFLDDACVESPGLRLSQSMISNGVKSCCSCK